MIYYTEISLNNIENTIYNNHPQLVYDCPPKLILNLSFFTYLVEIETRKTFFFCYSVTYNLHSDADNVVKI